MVNDIQEQQVDNIWQHRVHLKGYLIAVVVYLHFAFGNKDHKSTRSVMIPTMTLHNKLINMINL